MSLAQELLAHAVKLALVATLAGILARGLWRRCWTFPAYLVVILLGNSLVSLWPERFYTQAFWILKQGAYDVMKLAIAVELAWRTVRAFPGAAATARAAAAVLLPLSLAVVLTGTPHAGYPTLFQWQPQVVASTVWMFALTALLVAWYRLPVPFWHRAILLGFTPYLLVFVTLISALKSQHVRVWAWAGIADSVAYLALVSWWAAASWRRRQEAEVTLEDLGRPAAAAAPAHGAA